MKFKIIVFIVFIVIISPSLISCYYPEFYSFDDSNHETNDNSSQLTDNYNPEDAVFLRYPVRDYTIRKTKDNDICWDTALEFGIFSTDKNGYHSGEDWNLIGGKKGINEDLGKPVYAIGKGKIMAINKVGTNGSLGYIVVIEHSGSFKIRAWEKKDNQGQIIASYRSENDITKFYSVYLHLENIQIKENEEKNACESLVDEDTVLGYIMDPGGGPHLHFEIRKNINKHSNDWSLAGVAEDNNWINGYYVNLQIMIDAGLRNPSEFIDSNSNIIDMIKKLQENSN